MKKFGYLVHTKVPALKPLSYSILGCPPDPGPKEADFLNTKSVHILPYFPKSEKFSTKGSMQLAEIAVPTGVHLVKDTL